VRRLDLPDRGLGSNVWNSRFSSQNCADLRCSGADGQITLYVPPFLHHPKFAISHPKAKANHWLASQSFENSIAVRLWSREPPTVTQLTRNHSPPRPRLREGRLTIPYRKNQLRMCSDRDQGIIESFRNPMVKVHFLGCEIQLCTVSIKRQARCNYVVIDLTEHTYGAFRGRIVVCNVELSSHRPH
jgi:hypothetical protein